MRLLAFVGDASPAFVSLDASRTTREFVSEDEIVRDTLKQLVAPSCAPSLPPCAYARRVSPFPFGAWVWQVAIAVRGELNCSTASCSKVS